MPLPPLTESGDLPPGIHPASLHDVVARLGSGTSRRKLLAARLERVYQLALATGYLGRCIVFGSFVSAEPEPNDVDLFLLMNDGFDLNAVTGEMRILFGNAAAQAHFGASVFWLRRVSAFPDEEALVSGWQVKRDGTRRGIVEIAGDH